MEAKAIGKNIGVSRIKARIPADVVRNMDVKEAIAVLTYMPKGAAQHVKKVVESAAANATNNYNLNAENLYISEIKIDKGPISRFNVKRAIYKAKGGFATFNRQYCHITVIVKERSGVTEVEPIETKKVETKKEVVKANTKKAK